MQIAVLQHAPNEGPGEIAAWAMERGHAVPVCHIYRGDRLPDLALFDLLVVMGGEMNIYQDRDYPWLKEERHLIQSALAAGKKAVGICLGSQLIADALGARVTQNSQFEIGWFPVSFTEEAARAVPGLPTQATALHWHGDTFQLPPGATRLGTSAACGEQGYLIPGRCLGLQFHFETNPALVREMVEGSSAPSLWPKGAWVQNPATILSGAEKFCAENRPLLFLLLDNFVGAKS